MVPSDQPRDGDPTSFSSVRTATRDSIGGAEDGGSSFSDSCSNEEDEDDLPTDRASLQDELERVQETIQRLEEGTDDDFVLGCEMLLASKQSQVTRAYGNFERFKKTAIQLYEYECEQAKARYHARCEQLQREMSDEFQREIQRLKNTRDGVSVMDRRRLTRNSGGGVKGMDQKSNGGSSSSSMTKNGNHFLIGSSAQMSHSLSAAEEAHRVQYEEKKRLEVLLSKTPVFKQLIHRAESEEVTSDLDAITRAVQNRRRLSSQENGRRINSATGAIAHTKGGTVGVEKDEHREEESRSCASRLVFNPSMLQEGDEVVVYRRRRSAREEEDDDEMKQSHQQEEPQKRMERVMSGVITASTSTHVFLLTPSGKFETIEIREWKEGRIRLYAVEKRKRKR